LDNCATVWPGISEGPHVVQIAAGQAGHVEELGAQVDGQPVDDLSAPALLLPVEACPPDRPVQGEQLGVDGPLRSEAGGADLLLELFEQRGVVVGRLQLGAGHRTHRASTGGRRRGAAGRCAEYLFHGCLKRVQGVA